MSQDTYLVTVEVTRVTYSKPNSPWGIFKCRLDADQPEEGSSLPSYVTSRDQLTVTGELGETVQAGDLFDVEGTIERHPKFGYQLKALNTQPCARRDARALFSFLRRLPHIGRVRAREVVDLFGVDGTFEVLDETPERLAEVRGITEARARQAAAHFQQMEGLRAAWLFCRKLGLQPRVTTRIMERLGRKAQAVIERDPFLLMTEADMSFANADQVREALGISLDDPRRLAAGALMVIRAASNSGDCYHTEEHLIGSEADRFTARAKTQVRMTDTQIREGLQLLQEPVQVSETLTIAPRVVQEEDRLYLAPLHRAEATVCTRLRAMLEAA